MFYLGPERVAASLGGGGQEREALAARETMSFSWLCYGSIPLLLVDPSVGIGSSLHKAREIAVFKGRGFSPLLSVLIDPAESRIEEVSDGAVIGPDRTGYVSVAKRMNWLVCVFHGSLQVCEFTPVMKACGDGVR